MKSVSSSQAKKRMSIPLPQINYNSYKKAPTMFIKTENEKKDVFWSIECGDLTAWTSLHMPESFYSTKFRF